MEIVLKKFETFEMNEGHTVHSFNYKEHGLDEVNNGNIVFIDHEDGRKKYLIEKHEYMMKSFGMRGDNVLVLLKEIDPLDVMQMPKVNRTFT